MPTWTKEVVDLSVAGNSLTIDSIKIDGNTIGHTDDTDLLSLANGALTITGLLNVGSNLTVIGNISTGGTITGTLASAAQTNITSVGTLSSLTTSGNVTVGGDLTVSGGDITVNNMTSSGFIKCVATEGNHAGIELWADEGDDNADKWQIEAATDGELNFYSYVSGAWVPKFKVDTAGVATTSGHHYMGGVLYVGGANVDGTDRDIVFSHGTARTIMGIDNSENKFVINADNSGAYEATVANNSFTLDTSGNATIAGDLTISGNDIKGSGGTAITMDGSNNVTIAGDLTISGGKITFGNAEFISNESDNLVGIQNDSGPCTFRVLGDQTSPGATDYSAIQIGAAADAAAILLMPNSSDGAYGFSCGRDDVNNRHVLSYRNVTTTLTTDWNGTFGAMMWVDTSDVLTFSPGDVEFGKNSTFQGTLSLWDGGGGNTPGYLVLYSPNGTANYIFCEDDGTLKRHTSAPTAISDGTAIGDQSD